MLPENPPAGRKRPTARYKSAKGIANAKTRSAKKAGLIPQDMVPSQTRLVHRKWEDAWKAAHPHYRAAYNARRRQQRANARALKTAPTNSNDFFRACLQHPDCPRDEAGQLRFVLEKSLERGPAIEHSPPRHPPVKSFDSTSSVVPSRPRRTRSA